MSEPLVIWRCPECGEQLDPFDFIGGSITDVDHPVDGLGSPLCWECLNEDDREIHYEEVEVIPADSPNVLSVDEANDLAIAYITGAAAPVDRIAGLIDRLSDWVEREENAASENSESTEEGQ